MLQALEEGVKGGRWYSLMDKVASLKALRQGYSDVAKNGGAAGVDHQSVDKFGRNLDKELEKLADELRNGRYHPREVRRAWIPKPGSQEERPLGIPAVRDRVVQGALRHVLEPIFEAGFHERSYGFRPRRGCKEALRVVDRLLHEGYVHVVDADFKAYFDTIPHDALLRRVAEKVADGKVLDLVASYLKADILEGMTSWTPEEGSPQGAVVSPLLANIYLHPLDVVMAEQGFEMVRYADDFVVLCRSEAEAQRALETVKRWASEAGLTLHPDKTRIVDASQPGGFDFLGYHFERGMKWPRESSLKKFKDAIRVKTRRTNGNSMEFIIKSINWTARGWFAYFKHSHKTTFPRLDKWIRMRLRSILRKRSKRRGHGRGEDHQRWPNGYFSGLGLLSLVAAHVEACQSSRRSTINRRAGCGKSARPVRWEGRPA
jgi:RNA-directed DNA polymerase